MSEMVKRVARAWNGVCLIFASGTFTGYQIIDRTAKDDGTSPIGGKVIHCHAESFATYEACGLDRAPHGLMVLLDDFRARAAIAAMREPRGAAKAAKASGANPAA